MAIGSATMKIAYTSYTKTKQSDYLLKFFNKPILNMMNKNNLAIVNHPSQQEKRK